MYNTEAKKLLERYGFELKEAYNDVYTFENSHGDKVIFSDDRDPVFKILENSRMKSFLNQVNLDDLRIWLVQNQTAVYSKVALDTYSIGSWFKTFFENVKPDPKVVGAQFGNAMTLKLFMAAATVFGGAIAVAIANRIRKIGERPVTSDDLKDALTLVEQAREKLIKDGDKEARIAFEKKVDEIIHPYTKKFDSRAPKAKSYSKDNLEAYSFKSSVIAGLKKIRDLSADFLEIAIKDMFTTCASVTGNAVGTNISREIRKSDPSQAMDVAIEDLAETVEATHRSLPDDESKRKFAQKIRDAMDIEKQNKKDSKTTLADSVVNKKQQRKKGSMQGHSQMEDTTDMKTWLTDNKDKLGISDEFIEEITSKFDDDQIRSAVNEILNPDAEVKVD